MDKQPESRAPLIVSIVLLLLPVLYVGSCLAQRNTVVAGNVQSYFQAEYRTGGDIAKRFFWPLEQIDRKLRRQVWEPYPFW